jgi:hypothetical protein
MSRLGDNTEAEKGGGLVTSRCCTNPARLLLALCLVLSLLGARAQGAEAQSQAHASLATITRCEPEVHTWTPDEEAVVCIYVQDVEGLYGADFELSFPEMVGIAQVVDENTSSAGVQIARDYSWIPAGWAVFFNQADNSIGYLHYLTYGWNPAPAVSGSGPVACMRFHPDKAGEFTLTFTRHDLTTRTGGTILNTAHTCTVKFLAPTNVVISSFEATPSGRANRLQWETVSEVDLLGFNLYRASSVDGPRTQVNEDLIPTQANPGSPVGAVYTYNDLPMGEGGTYFYWLEYVDIDGTTALHGPIQATRSRRSDGLR